MQAMWEPRRTGHGWREWWFAACAAGFWYSTTLDVMRASPLGVTPWPPAFAAALAVGVQAVVSATEAAWYGVVARALGGSGRWRVLALRLFLISTASALAGWLATRDAPLGSGVAVALLGPRGRDSPLGAGLAGRAFGEAGLLLAVRIALTGDALATSAAIRHRWALVAAAASWAASRLAHALVAGLLLGRSVTP